MTDPRPSDAEAARAADPAARGWRAAGVPTRAEIAGRARVAIVLGAAVRPDGTPSPTLALRVRRGVALWRAGRVDRLCLTGGIGLHGAAEAEVAAALARALGVPQAALILEASSVDTNGNIARALPLLPPGAVLTLVSNRWHLPRAWLIARLHGHRAGLCGPRGRAGPGRTAAAILREVCAIPLSAWRAVRAAGRRR